MKKLNRRYVSEEDQFLRECHKQQPLSDSQQAEIDKARWIAERRDKVQPEDGKSELWEQF